MPNCWTHGHLNRYQSLAMLVLLLLSLSFLPLMVNVVPVAHASPSLNVSVGYADDSHGVSGAYPSPWCGDSSVAEFIGVAPSGCSTPGVTTSGTTDGGAVLISNTGGTPVTVQSVVVTLPISGGGTATSYGAGTTAAEETASRPIAFTLWGSFTIPAGKSAILDQTTPGPTGGSNFDTSDWQVVAGCGPKDTNAADAPTIDITTADGTTRFVDSARVLDTGGFDCRMNGTEYEPWQLVTSSSTTSPTVPSGVITYVPLTLTNSQSAATPTPFQQMIQVDSATYSTYEASNLQNLEFFDSGGTVLKAWCESSCTSASPSSTVWVNLGSDSVPGSGTLTIYLGFLSISANNMGNTGTSVWGEYPTATGTYGQFDDGAAVFTDYWNFAGIALPSQWGEYHGGSTGSYSVDNGLTISTTGAYGDWIEVDTATTFNSESLVADAYWQSDCLASCQSLTPGGAYGIIFGSQHPADGSGAFASNGYATSATTCGSICSLSGYYATDTGPYAYTVMTPATPLDTNWHVLTVYETPTMGCGALDYTVANACSGSNYTPSSSSYVQVSATGIAGPQTDDLQWARLRSQPPNGVMPSATPGSTTTTTTITTTTTALQTALAVGCSPITIVVYMTTTCTATVTGGSSPAGTVTFASSSNTGVFSPSNGQCTLASESCSVTYSDSTAGSPKITASYGGDSHNAATSPPLPSAVVTVTTSMDPIVVDAGLMKDTSTGTYTFTLSIVPQTNCLLCSGEDIVMLDQSQTNELVTNAIAALSLAGFSLPASCTVSAPCYGIQVANDGIVDANAVSLVDQLIELPNTLYGLADSIASYGVINGIGLTAAQALNSPPDLPTLVANAVNAFVAVDSSGEASVIRGTVSISVDSAHYSPIYMALKGQSIVLAINGLSVPFNLGSENAVNLQLTGDDTYIPTSEIGVLLSTSAQGFDGPFSIPLTLKLNQDCFLLCNNDYTGDSVSGVVAVTATKIESDAAYVDQTSATGITVGITDEGASDGTSLSVITQSYGSGHPNSTPYLTLSSDWVTEGFYDVQVTGITSGTATVCITNPNIDSSTIIEYSKDWLPVQTTVTGTTACGTIDVSSLSGTPIVIINQLTHVPRYHPSIATSLSISTVSQGGSVTDSATLSGVWASAGGTVTYWYSPGSTCAGPYYQVGSLVTVTNGVVPNSQPQNFSRAGSYSWIAAYSGDYNDQGAESACELLTVTDPVSSISTTLSQTIVAVGQSVTESVTLAGVFNAGGTVTYQYFSGSTCSGTPTIVGSPVSVTDGVVPNSAPHAFGTPGYYSWNAVYSGDTNNLGVTGGCNVITVNASPMTFTISCGHASVVVGATVTCKATVQGSSSAPTGSVTWSSGGSGTFSTTSCTLLKHKTSGACSVKYTPTAAGSVVFTASYAGDSKNFPSAGTYSLAVTMKATKTSVFCTPTSAVAGSTITCIAKLTGYSPTGTVTWSQSGAGSVSFDSVTCSLSQGTCSLTMTAATSGHITIAATYAGDLNNQGSSKTAKLTIK